MANIVYRLGTTTPTLNLATLANANPLSNAQMDANMYALQSEVEAATAAVAAAGTDSIAYAIALG